MPTAALVFSPAQLGSLHDLARSIAFELERQNVPCELHTTGVPSYRHDRVIVLLDPIGYATTHDMEDLEEREMLNRTAFVYDQGRIPAEGSQARAFARRAGAVFTLDLRSARLLQRDGIPARVLRLGYSESLDQYHEDDGRSIDVALLAPETPRNARHVADAHDALACLALATHDPGGIGDPPTPSVLTQSKVMLNLHGEEGSEFRWQDALEAIHAGAVVVTEHSSMIAPLKVGEHLLVASADALPYVAESLLRDPERLVGIRRAAYERIRSWMPFALAVSILRASLVELVSSAPPVMHTGA